MKTFAIKLAVVITASLFLGAAQREALAGSATWSADAINGDWNTSTNWVPSTIPNSTFDVATFGQSAVTNLSITTDSVQIDSMVFNSDAAAYTISVAGANLQFFGAGMVNDSNFVQSITRDPHGLITFFNSSSAGERTSFGGAGSLFIFSGSSSAASANFDVISDPIIQATLDFEDSATAANATITVSYDALINFFGNSTAAHAVIQANTGGFMSFGDDTTADHVTVTITNDDAGFGGSGIDFQQGASAANGIFSAGGATSSGGSGSFINVSDSATAGDAKFGLGGGSAPAAAGTVMHFYDTSTAANATITVDGGTNGGKGASVIFNDASLGGTARFIVNGNGILDIRQHSPYLVTIGSLEGDGRVFLGAGQLGVGSAETSTTFSGSIEDGSNGSGGRVAKVGTGTLTLSAANTYTGGTTVNSGALIVSNTIDSATGTGSVGVDGGILAGGGTISGAVTVGMGSGSGATLQPSFGTNKKITLTIQSQLTLNADATYSFSLKSKKAEIVANGVTILSGAQFTMTAPKRKLRAGIRATVISNTSSSPISGTFANLADGATITSGGNTYQANYEGGDGNDLTLTVQP